MSHYQGHLPDGSSIQRHSAGGLYPFVLYAQQCGSEIRHGYQAPGQAGILVGSYDAAAAAALQAKQARAALARRQAQLNRYQASRKPTPGVPS